MCFSKPPSVQAPARQTPAPAAPLAPENPVDTAESARAAVTARRRLRNDLAIPAATGVGLAIPQ